MNVNFEKTDQVNAVLTVSLVEEDYMSDVKRELNKLGQQRPLKGFRPGHVPMPLLQKFYGSQVKAELIDRLLNRTVSNYLVENKVQLLGEPILQESGNMDLDIDKEFEFKFDLGLAPEFDLTIDKSVTIPYYNITVTDEMVQQQSEAYRKRFGKQVPGEEVAEDSMIRGSLVELDEAGNEKAKGIKAERTVLMPMRIHDQEQKQLLVGAKVGQQVVINPGKATDNNAVEMASMLNIEKEQAEDLNSDFRLTIDEIMVNQIADLDQEFFDNVLGAGEAHDEQEYLEKLKVVVTNQYVADSNYRFTIDAENVLRGMVGNLPLPEDFLKRFLQIRNKDLTAEKIEEEFSNTKSHLQWQLIMDKVAASLQVKVGDEDRQRLARFMAAQQFAQYGMTNLPDDVIANYANKLMEDERYRNEINDRAFSDNIFAALKAAVTLDEHQVSTEEFNKLFEAN